MSLNIVDASGTIGQRQKRNRARLVGAAIGEKILLC